MELFVGGLAEELEVDDRVAAVEAGRLTEGVDGKIAEGVDERIEQFVGACIPVVPLTRNVLLSAQMGEQAPVVPICIITSRYNEVK